MSTKYKEFSEVPTSVLASRLAQIGEQLTKGNFSDLSMSIPAQLDRDADLVLTNAGVRLIELQERVDARVRSVVKIERIGLWR